MSLMTHDPDKLPEIPLMACPDCKAGMAIKSVRPRLLRSGVDVEFTCPRCEAIVLSSVPSKDSGANQQSAS